MPGAVHHVIARRLNRQDIFLDDHNRGDYAISHGNGSITDIININKRRITMTQKALLVGINNYKQINDLNGCLNDITNVRDVLQKYSGFATADIRLLADSRATKANIMARLEWLVKGAKDGDTLVFHYSGHGTQIRDRHGDELKDHMDEAICPWDINWDGGLILDDDLSAFFATLKKGVTLEVILDSCHSGSGTRDLILGADVRSRFLAPPIDIECRVEEDLPVKKLAVRKVEKGLNHVLWAGCRDNQTSADAMIGNAYNGAFTYFFCKHIRDAQGKIARSELLKRVRASLKHNNFSQIPQLELPSETAKKTTIFGK